MNDETTTISAPEADALVLLGILALFGSVFELNVKSGGRVAIGLLLLAILMLAAAFAVRRKVWLEDEKNDKKLLNGYAVVDARVLDALAELGMSLHIRRAVESAGTDQPLQDFVNAVKEECQDEITEEQLDAIIRLIRVRKLPPKDNSMVTKSPEKVVSDPIMSIAEAKQASATPLPPESPADKTPRSFSSSASAS